MEGDPSICLLLIALPVGLWGVSALTRSACSSCQEAPIKSFFFLFLFSVAQQDWWPGHVFGDPERWKRGKCCPSGDDGHRCRDRAGVSQGGLGLGQISGSLLLLSACISNPHGEMRSAFPQPEVCTGSCLGSPNYFFPRRKKCVYAFFSTSWRLDAARKSIPNKKSGINVNYTSVRFTFILIRHISSKCDFLLGLVIKVFCTAKETSPVLFSGSMNSRICLWVFQLLRHQWGSVRSGTRRWQAAFLSLLIYCLSENQILNTWSINIISALK